MKSLITAITVGALSVSSGYSDTITLLEDNFDSYTTGVVANSSNWPSAIPGTSPALSWRTDTVSASDTGGPQEILNASVAGRTGNIYSYSENGTGQRSTFSTATLNSAYSGTDDWTLSVDFYVESMPSGVGSGTYAIATVSNGDVSTAANILTSVSAIRTQSNANLNLHVTSGGGGSFFVNEYLDLDTWYTLTITGNNLSEELSLSIVGEAGAYNETRSGSYSNSHGQFDTVSIGDTVHNAFATGRDNQVYLDNLSLTAVPEPASALGLLVGGAGLVARKGRRRG